jgi:hypothetical protein
MSSSSESDSSAVQRAHCARAGCSIGATNIASSVLELAGSLSASLPDTHHPVNTSFRTVANSRGNTHPECHHRRTWMVKMRIEPQRQRDLAQTSTRGSLMRRIGST